MDETTGKARPNVGYNDLRDLLEQIENMGELLRVDGAHWDKEIGALQEMIHDEFGDKSPAILFENIPARRRASAPSPGCSPARAASPWCWAFPMWTTRSSSPIATATA